MVWWIAGGIVVLALLGLVVVVGSAVGSLRRFAQAGLSLKRRLDDARQRIEPRLTALQGRVEELRRPIAITQERMLEIQTRRAAD